LHKGCKDALFKTQKSLRYKDIYSIFKDEEIRLIV